MTGSPTGSPTGPRAAKSQHRFPVPTPTGTGTGATGLRSGSDAVFAPTQSLPVNSWPESPASTTCGSCDSAAGGSSGTTGSARTSTSPTVTLAPSPSRARVKPRRAHEGGGSGGDGGEGAPLALEWHRCPRNPRCRPVMEITSSGTTGAETFLVVPELRGWPQQLLWSPSRGRDVACTRHGPLSLSGIGATGGGGPVPAAKLPSPGPEPHVRARRHIGDGAPCAHGPGAHDARDGRCRRPTSPSSVASPPAGSPNARKAEPSLVSPDRRQNAGCRPILLSGHARRSTGSLPCDYGDRARATGLPHSSAAVSWPEGRVGFCPS